MPELTIPYLPLTALSEPVLLADGRLVFAHETLARDTIEVREIRLAGTTADMPWLASLPGAPSPSDDGKVIALWPRLAQTNRALMAVWQHGPSPTYANWIDGQPNIGPSVGEAHGIWPASVAEWPDYYFEAPPSTSQGVFGYLDGRWWLYDEIWQSSYQRAIPGVLSGGWRDANNVLHLVSAYGEKTDNSDAQVLYWNDRDQQVMVVMRGPVRWPRGCSLVDGRVYIHGSALGGYYRAAIGPFEEVFRKDEDQMPVPKVTILPGWGPQEIRLGESVAVGVMATNAVSVSVWLVEIAVPGQTQAFGVEPRGEVKHLTPERVGMWNIRAHAVSADGQIDTTASPRIVTVLPPEEKPRVEITEEEWLDFDARAEAVAMRLLDVVRAVAWTADRITVLEPRSRWLARYATGRGNGSAHEAAALLVLGEMQQFIEDELRKAKEELG